MRIGTDAVLNFGILNNLEDTLRFKGEFCYKANLGSKKNIQPVLIEFFATWCGPCQTMVPVLDTISETRKDLKILRIDIDKNPRLIQTFRVSNVPTFIFMKNGKEKWRRSGIMSYRTLNDLLNS